MFNPFSMFMPKELSDEELAQLSDEERKALYQRVLASSNRNYQNGQSQAASAQSAAPDMSQRFNAQQAAGLLFPTPQTRQQPEQQPIINQYIQSLLGV